MFFVVFNFYQGYPKKLKNFSISPRVTYACYDKSLLLTLFKLVSKMHTWHPPSNKGTTCGPSSKPGERCVWTGRPVPAGDLFTGTTLRNVPNSARIGPIYSIEVTLDLWADLPGDEADRTLVKAASGAVPFTKDYFSWAQFRFYSYTS